MSQSTTFNMNRNNNNNNRNSRVENGNAPFQRQNRDGRIIRADGSEDRSNTNTNTAPFQRNNRSNGSRGNRSDGSENRDGRNPFHRENRGNRNNNGGGNYKDWKNRGSAPYNPYAPPVPPPPKVLTADDFPALISTAPTVKRVPDTNTWTKPEVSLADRMKERLEEEEERKANGRLVDPEDDDKLDVIPLSSWMRSKYVAKMKEEVMKQREANEYEANYRWQISKAMIPPQMEKEMPAYEPGMEDEFEDATDGQNGYEAEPAAEYEERR